MKTQLCQCDGRRSAFGWVLQLGHRQFPHVAFFFSHCNYVLISRYIGSGNCDVKDRQTKCWEFKKKIKKTEIRIFFLKSNRKRFEICQFRDL